MRTILDVGRKGGERLSMMQVPVAEATITDPGYAFTLLICTPIMLVKVITWLIKKTKRKRLPISL